MKPATLVALLVLTITANANLLAQQLKTEQSTCGSKWSRSVSPAKISTEFREVGQDAFAKLESLESVALKTETFYQPALHDADVAVRKASVKASNEDEKQLAYCLSSYQALTEIYRSEVAIDQKMIFPSEKKESAERLSKLEADRRRIAELARAVLTTPKKRPQ